MTNLYFLRHAQTDYTVQDDTTRPLTKKRLQDRRLVTAYLQNKGIDRVYASPYVRAIDTVAEFADKFAHTIVIHDDLRERKAGLAQPWRFCRVYKNQWADFSYTMSGGESLQQVQQRNTRVVKQILGHCPEQNIVIGTHGTALSTIINYYDPAYGYADFMDMIHLNPWVVHMAFAGTVIQRIEKIDVTT